MAFAFLLPLLSRTVAGAIGLPLAPLTIAAVFALTLRRALNPAVGADECGSPGARGRPLALAGTMVGRDTRAPFDSTIPGRRARHNMK